MFDKADQLPAHVGLGERVVEDSLAPEIEGVTTVSRVVDINRWLIGFGPLPPFVGAWFCGVGLAG